MCHIHFGSRTSWAKSGILLPSLPTLVNGPPVEIPVIQLGWGLRCKATVSFSSQVDGCQCDWLVWLANQWFWLVTLFRWKKKIQVPWGNYPKHYPRESGWSIGRRLSDHIDTVRKVCVRCLLLRGKRTRYLYIPLFPLFINEGSYLRCILIRTNPTGPGTHRGLQQCMLAVQLLRKYGHFWRPWFHILVVANWQPVLHDLNKSSFTAKDLIDFAQNSGFLASCIRVSPAGVSAFDFDVVSLCGLVSAGERGSQASWHWFAASRCKLLGSAIHESKWQT